MEAIETARVIIRPFVMDDLEELYSLYRQPELMQYVDGKARSYDETKEYLQSYLADYERYGFGLCAAVLKSTGKIVGRCGLIPVKATGGEEGELAFLFEKQYWGLGLATEVSQELLRYAFEELELRRVFATANHNNKASIRVLEKAGMQCVKLSATDVEYEIQRIDK